MKKFIFIPEKDVDQVTVMLSDGIIFINSEKDKRIVDERKLSLEEFKESLIVIELREDRR